MSNCKQGPADIPLNCDSGPMPEAPCCPPVNLDTTYCDTNLAIVDTCELHADPYDTCGDLCDCLPCFATDTPENDVGLTPEAKAMFIAFVQTIGKLVDPTPNPCGCDGEPYQGTSIVDRAVPQQMVNDDGELIYVDNITGKDTTKPTDKKGNPNLGKPDICCGDSAQLLNSVFLKGGVDPYAHIGNFDNRGIFKDTGTVLTPEAKENVRQLICCAVDRINDAPELIIK